ncbi:MAG: hypothetical protein K9L30_11930 [Desulfobacterales bacterium]|nr:hypothetical protein [Desulfobacterales bacterium]
MSKQLKAVLMFLMALAMSFGFLHLFVLGGTIYDFERLHIFLFNLCAGGTAILFYTEKKAVLSKRSLLFLILAIIYAILAFLELYLPAVIISIVLAVIVESIRIKRFSFLPRDFVRPSVPVSEKFNQASLLCLSMGLVISGIVILNDVYFHIFTFEMLTLNTFFLGFSFPVSLITFSVIFSLMKNDVSNTILVLKEIGFWSINLGVIIFFLLIIAELLVPQVFITHFLLFSVLMVFFLFYKLGIKTQQKAFLSSGIAFLLYTALTGIAYITFKFFPDYYIKENMKLLLRMHSFASLYGWNLCGLAIVCRYKDFPIKLHSMIVILFHWLTVIIFAPLGTLYPVFAIVTIFSYIAILGVIFFNKRDKDKSNPVLN